MRALNFLRQTPARRRLAMEAAVALLRAWWLVRFRAFRDYAAALGEPRPGGFQATETAPADRALLGDVVWAIDAVNRTAGGRFTCLMQGIAAKVLLNRRGVANTLVLGAARRSGATGADAGMAAHAWLRVGPMILLGAKESAGFVPVASYHSP